MKRHILFGLIVSLLFASHGVARDWQVIKDSGVLKVGLRSGAQIVYRPSDKDKPGMIYEMVRDFAKKHGLTLQVETVPAFKSYWQKGDEILLKTGRVATPDIYDRIDIAAEVFTVTGQRKKLVHMTPYLDNVELLFGSPDLVVRSYDDLIGMSIFTFEAMSFYRILLNELDSHKTPYQIIYVQPNNGGILIPTDHKDSQDKVNLYILPMETEVDGAMSYHPVALRMADIGINDGIAVMVRIFGNSFYKENLKPLMPAQKQKTQLAWGTRHDDRILNTKIQTFLDEYKASGAFSDLLEKYIGMNLVQYHQMINMMQ